MHTWREKLAPDPACARVAPDPGRASVAPCPGHRMERVAAHVQTTLAVHDAWAGLAANDAPRLAADHAAEILAVHPGGA